MQAQTQTVKKDKACSVEASAKTEACCVPVCPPECCDEKSIAKAVSTAFLLTINQQETGKKVAGDKQKPSCQPKPKSCAPSSCNKKTKASALALNGQ